MKKLTTLFVLSACAILAGRMFAQDPVKVAPTAHKVLLNNDRVRVLDTTVKANSEIPMHAHPDNIVYVLKGGKVSFVDAKGKSTDRELKDGECIMRPAETHAVKNTSGTDLHVITVELKK